MIKYVFQLFSYLLKHFQLQSVNLISIPTHKNNIYKIRAALSIRAQFYFFYLEHIVYTKTGKKNTLDGYH